ncbi:YlxR family protein [Lacisediminihabitans sp.]|uniref:YlxR family protein n=1 Tax=Lacisediminihabitans sp. TaxID=2787631 RepID=UPI002F93E39B
MKPVRTCLGCRQRAERSSLLRVVARDGEAVVDFSATLPGRGAWVHPTVDCVGTSITRKAFGRALRVDGVLAMQQLSEAVQTSTTHQSEPHGSLKNRLNGKVTN